jgi:membrane fusion protein (multidrug efflux system)
VDPRDYQAKRDQAAAAAAASGPALGEHRVPLARELTRAQADEARASLEAARVAERAAESAVEEYVARVESRRAAVAAMRADVQGPRHRAPDGSRARVRQLAKGGYVAERDVDQAEAVATTSASTLEATRRRLIQAEREVQQAEAELASRKLAVAQARERALEARATVARAESQRHTVPLKEAEVLRAAARVREANADLALAELQMSHTEVRAPVDGVIAKQTVELGQIVQMGQPLMAIVPLHSVWVVANFKETQLGRVRPGQQAWVEVDGFPGKHLNAVVDSISAGTGSRFSLRRPNATGNW